MTFHQAMQIAEAPRSRFFFGSPCRFVAHIDFTCHLLVPAVLRSGDVSQQSVWDRGRLLVSQRLMATSPRWQHLTRGLR
jgi:hypothetical protein